MKSALKISARRSLKKYEKGGTLTPFEQAFAKARKELGPNATFPYKGKTYTTQYKEEVGVKPASTATKSGTSFDKVFAAERERLGPGKTFTYNGKQYSTNYATEVSGSTQKTTQTPKTETKPAPKTVEKPAVVTQPKDRVTPRDTTSEAKSSTNVLDKNHDDWRMKYIDDISKEALQAYKNLDEEGKQRYWNFVSSSNFRPPSGALKPLEGLDDPILYLFFNRAVAKTVYKLAANWPSLVRSNKSKSKTSEKKPEELGDVREVRQVDRIPEEVTPNRIRASSEPPLGAKVGKTYKKPEPSTGSRVGKTYNRPYPEFVEGFKYGGTIKSYQNGGTLNTLSGIASAAGGVASAIPGIGPIVGAALNSVVAPVLGALAAKQQKRDDVNQLYSNISIMEKGGLIKRKDGSYSKRGLWDNLRSKAAENKRTGAKPKAPTKQMLEQERKIKASKEFGGTITGNSDLSFYKGKSHRDGGIMVNSKGVPSRNASAEVEGGETRFMYKDKAYIFSDKLTI